MFTNRMITSDKPSPRRFGLVTPVSASVFWIVLCIAIGVVGILTGGTTGFVLAAVGFVSLPALVHLILCAQPASSTGEIWVAFSWIMVALTAVLMTGGAASPLTVMLALGPLHALSSGRIRLAVETSIFAAVGYLGIATLSVSGMPLPSSSVFGLMPGLGALISVLQIGLMFAATRLTMSEQKSRDATVDRWMSTLSETPVLILNVDRRRRVRSWVGDVSLIEGMTAKRMQHAWLDDVFENSDALLRDGDAPRVKGNTDAECEAGFLKVSDGYRFVITPARKVEAPVVAAPVAEDPTDASVWVASLGHELRNMLNPVGGYSDLILAERAGPLGEPYKEFAKSIKRGAEHLGLLVDDLMTAAKSRSGKLRIEPETLDAGLEAEDAISLLQWQSDANQVGVELVGETKDLEVIADRKALRQILINLLSNAIKYSMPAQKVRVDVGAQDGFVVFSVADQGEGLPLEELERLGEPFFQGENARKRSGTGLGLSIVVMLAEAMGGRVAFESEQGRGTTAHVFLPQASLVTEAVEENASSAE